MSPASMSGQGPDRLVFVARTAEQAVDDPHDDVTERQVEDAGAGQRGEVEHRDERRIRQPTGVLVVAGLADVLEVGVGDDPQRGRQDRGHLTREGLVRHLQRPHLLTAEPARTLEVIGQRLGVGKHSDRLNRPLPERYPSRSRG